MGDRDHYKHHSFQLHGSRCRVLILGHLHEAVPPKQQCFVLRIFVRRIVAPPPITITTTLGQHQ